jgi:DNA-binding response OmpR family regulator
MKTLNVLLGCSERRVSNPIEVLLHDICFNYAAVNCITAARIDEFMHKGSMQNLDLIVAVVDHLLPVPGRRFTQLEEVLSTLQTIRSRVTTPILVVGNLNDEVRFMEAGAEAVIGFPFQAERLRETVRQILRIPEPVQPAEANPTSSGNFWWKRLQKLVTAS